jgi:hypothetical protein
MANSVDKRQKFIRYFKQVKGVTEVDMHDVAALAKQMGWPLPKPKDPLDILAKQFADAASEETRKDKLTKKPYRANLSFLRRLGDGKQLWLWFDVDDPMTTRGHMVKGLHLYREQMVSEAVIGVSTAEHWSHNHPDQEPLPFVTDLTDDVQERNSAATLEKEKNNKKVG